MSAYNKGNILLNNGETIYIATFQTGEPEVGAQSIAKGTNHPPSVTNFSMDVIALSKPVVPDSVVTMLSTPVSLDVIQSATYISAKEQFNNNVRWVWGTSLDSGGVYIRKVANGLYKIGGVTAFVKINQNDTYYYVINEQSVASPLGDFTDVTFMYEEAWTELNYPVMRVFCSGGIRNIPDAPSGTLDHYYNYRIYDGILNVYNDYVGLDSMYEPTRYITWEGLLGDKPSCYWIANSGVTRPKNLSYEILGLRDEERYTIISGDPWGGQLADDEDDPTEEGGNSQEGGGGGSYPSGTGHVDTPNSESMGVDITNSGFVTIYNPTQAQVKSFANWLFSDITDAISTQLKRLWANPLDFTLFLALAHFTPVSKVDDVISYAGISTGITAHKCKQFKYMDMGYINLEGDTKMFLDYQPYTKISIYLPYIGIRQLNPDELIGSRIELSYNIDCGSGACIATLKCIRGLRRSQGDAELDDVVYHFDGNCFEQIPLTATDWRGMITSMFNVVGGVGSIVGGVAGGNAGAIGTGVTQVVDGVISQKVTVSRTGQLSGSSGYMDSQIPYLIIERPIDDNPYNYRAFKGFVLNMRYKLSNLSGYTEIESETLWLNGFNGITEEEAQMLKDVTSSGFYL